MAALIALTVSGALAGLLLLVLGLMPSEPRSASRPPSTLLRWARRRRVRLTRSQLTWLAVGVVAGIVLWAVSGWVVLLVVLPAAALGLPYLLAGDDAKQNLERLDALESWTRSLAGLTQTGTPLEEIIKASLPSVPEAIRPEVATLVARLNARWRTRDALWAFADDMRDATSDLVVMHLLLAEQQRGPGLTAALEQLAQDIFDEVKVRRQVETDRSKPKQNMRIITATTLVILLLLPLMGAFMTPYRTLLGQAILVVWLILYVVVLIWLKRLTATKPSPRTLDGDRLPAAEAEEARA